MVPLGAAGWHMLKKLKLAQQQVGYLVAPHDLRARVFDGN